MKSVIIISTPRRASTISHTGVCVFTRVSQFDIRYSIILFFFLSLSPFAFRLSYETGVHRKHAEACVYDFVYRGLCLFTRLPIRYSIIRYSIFIIFLFPFAFRLSPFAFHMKPAFIASTPRHASTISHTGVCVFTRVSQFDIRYSIFIIFLFPFAFRLLPFAFPHPFFSINPTPKMYHIAQISLILF